MPRLSSQSIGVTHRIVSRHGAALGTARGRRLGVRRRAARWAHPRPARRRRDPLRHHRRWARLPALAGHRRGRQPLLGRPQQGQAVDRHRPVAARRPRARDRRSSPRPATTPASSSRTSPSRAGSPTPACARSAPDLVYLNIVGNPDESTAVDYTVNAASGIATATGPVGSLFPVNNALPAWDIATGLNAVIGILAAERHRRTTGEGQLVKLSLADVAFTMVANLGFLAQAAGDAREPAAARQRHVRRVRPRLRRRSDGRRVMVVAISLNQWHTLVDATGIEEHLAPMERAFDADFRKEEDRYRARDGIAALLKPWFEVRTLDEVRKALDEHGVCWGPYQTFTQLLDDDWRVVADEPRVRRRRPPRHRHAAHPGVAAAVPDRSAVPAGAGAAARHAHRRRARLACSASPPPRSAACTTTASSPAKCRSDRERGRRGADPRRRRVRRTGPRHRSPASRPRALAACIDADPAVLDHGTLPRLWHWACFLPLVPTAQLGRDGHPRRRPEMDGVPAAHVGRWPGAASSGRSRLDVDAAAFVAHRAGRAEGRRQRTLLARHRRARDQPGRRGVRRRGAGPGVPRGLGGRDTADPTATTRPTAPWVEELRRRPRAAVPVLGRHRERAPHPLRPPVRHRGRGLSRPRRARPAHRDPPRRARRGVGATASSTRCRTAPVRRTSPTTRSG